MPGSVIRNSLSGMDLRQYAFLPSYRGDDPTISTYSYHSIGEEFNALNTGNFANTAWPSANRAIAIPFVVTDNFLVKRMFWFNGGTATTDESDIGIYNEAFGLVVASGTTSITGSNALQYLNVTDTLLVPGRYWMARSQNGTTATNFALNSGTASITRCMGVIQMTAAHPLPSTFVPEVAAGVHTPMLGLTSRS